MSELSPSTELRKAAERIRETACAANLGTWWADETEIYSHEQPGWVGETLQLDDPKLGKANAAHVVLWQPTVALLVAAWLEDEADEADNEAATSIYGAAGNDFVYNAGDGHPALKLARAINGSAS